MKKSLLIGSVLSLFVLQMAVAQSKAKPDSLVWHTDLKKVQEISKKTKKPIFGFFTGSDWCGWCHKLQSDVFAKPEFIKWANEKVVLLELDFPRRKTLPAELAKQNMELQKAFGIQGYPTIWLFFIKEKENNQTEIAALGSLGYPSGATVGQEQVKFLETANALLAAGKK
jgi:protein disulfide-isomerase